MTRLEELQKAIEETAAAGTEMLKKSQMGLLDPHHVAYTRTNASGTVSNIAAKGSPNANAVHEHYPWGRLTKVEGKGVRAVLHPEHQEAIGSLQDGESTRFKDEQGIDWTAKRNGEHVELKAPSRISGETLRVKHSDVAATGNTSTQPKPASQPAASVSDQLADLKTPQYGTTFSQRMAYHGKRKGLHYSEVARMSSALHASEAAQSAEGHTRAYHEHTAAAKEATDPVYKKFHEESAVYHQKEASNRS